MVEAVNVALGEEVAAIGHLVAVLHNHLKVVQVRCLAHVLQLAVKEGLKQCPLMDDSIRIIRDVLKKTSESPSLLEALQEVCKSVNVAFESPELDCATRWNSTLTMLSSARSLRVAIEELQRRIRCKHEGYKDFCISARNRVAAPISEATWGYVIELITFLRQIKGATTMLSGKNYPTFGVALVVFHLVGQYAVKMMKTAVSWYTQDFARAFKHKLDEYLPHVRTNEAIIAAVLDPRSKGYLAKMGLDIAAVKRLVEAEYESHYQEEYLRREAAASAQETTQEQTEEAADAEALHSLIDEHLAMESPENDDGDSFASELNRWLDHKDTAMTLKTTSRALCQWMRNEAASYPRIQMMGRDFLAVITTSVPSEQAFSASGTTITKRRTCLKDDAITAILEIQSFLEFNATAGNVHAERVDACW